MSSPGGSVVKNPCAVAESGRRVWFLVWEDPLEGMATHSSILAWQIPWTEEPGRLQSMESQSRTQVSNWTSPEIFISVSSALSSLYKAINLIHLLTPNKQKEIYNKCFVIVISRKVLHTKKPIFLISGYKSIDFSIPKDNWCSKKKKKSI